MYSAYCLHFSESFFSRTRSLSQRVENLQILRDTTQLPFKEVSSIHASSPVKYQNVCDVCVFVSQAVLTLSFSSLPV